jgi:energy-coupling factor transporter ATP-binding protein EcfA2
MAKPVLENITLKSGPSPTSPPLVFAVGTVNVFVGPNHSGKSALLQELQSLAQQTSPSKGWKLLGDATFTPWTVEERTAVIEELTRSAKESQQPGPPTFTLSKGEQSWSVVKSEFERALMQLSKARDIAAETLFRNGMLHGWFNRVGGAARLSILAPSKRDAPAKRHSHLLSRLFYSDEHRATVQAIVHDAFALWLVVDPFGENFEVKFSDVAPTTGTERSLSEAAAHFFNGCATFDKMSDGVRAFAGMVAAVVASDAKVILIDEPEAFLHPALCTKLARHLCSRAQAKGQQLFNVCAAGFTTPTDAVCRSATSSRRSMKSAYTDGEFALATHEGNPKQFATPDEWLPLESRLWCVFVRESRRSGRNGRKARSAKGERLRETCPCRLALGERIGREAAGRLTLRTWGDPKLRPASCG